MQEKRIEHRLEDRIRQLDTTGVPLPFRCFFAAEVKDGAKVASARRLTADEMAWHARWSGDVRIVESVDEALALLEVRR